MINLWSRLQQRSRSRIYFVGLCALTVLCFASLEPTASAQTGDETATTSNHKQEISIGDSLQRPGSTPLHILYIHGIGAVDSGDSYVLRKKICDFLKDCTTAEGELKLIQTVQRHHREHKTTRVR